MLHTYIHTYIHTDIQTDRQTDRQVYRPSDEVGCRGAFAPKKLRERFGKRRIILGI